MITDAVYFWIGARALDGMQVGVMPLKHNLVLAFVANMNWNCIKSV